jgi:hypothetical protein
VGQLGSLSVEAVMFVYVSKVSNVLRYLTLDFKIQPFFFFIYIYIYIIFVV